ncbi:DUF4328 domain-containing protein [Desmospora profundinema]|uniref:DUF4328 domain-containing protein n=1 Tax=Desmospora profundinema TaxID=1571184 RepID=A0ABU1IL73_9BACL|nr:DUF4328 domain-containing protein [Desmospora profundinema]MDR6224699.1 hypothetical protein [Desmospora profundinema]
MNEHPYESAQGRAKWVQILFVAYIVFSLLTTALIFVENSLMSSAVNEVELEENAAFFLVVITGFLVGLIMFPLGIALVVVFCMWVHRIHRNLPSLGAQELKFTPGWAVGWYFIPIANLIQPFNAAREAWKASDPAVEKEPNTSWKTQPVAGLVLAWWILFIVGNILSNQSLLFSWRAEETIDAMMSVNNLFILTGLVDIVSALLAIFFVRKLTERQEERRRLMPQDEQARAWM